MIVGQPASLTPASRDAPSRPASGRPTPASPLSAPIFRRRAARAAAASYPPRRPPRRSPRPAWPGLACPGRGGATAVQREFERQLPGLRVEAARRIVAPHLFAVRSVEDEFHVVVEGHRQEAAERLATEGECCEVAAERRATRGCTGMARRSPKGHWRAAGRKSGGNCWRCWSGCRPTSTPHPGAEAAAGQAAASVNWSQRAFVCWKPRR
jgi:hypothetical protein